MRDQYLLIQEMNVHLIEVVLGSAEACRDTTATMLGYSRPLDWKVLTTTSLHQPLITIFAI